MLTDRELAEAAWNEFILADRPYSRVANYPPERLALTHWGKGKALQDQIGVQLPPPPSDTPPPPSLNSPAKLTPKSGQSNILDAGGGDCYVTAPSVLEQGTNRNADAVVLVQNAKQAWVENILTHSPYLQNGPGQTGYGYGHRFRSIEYLYVNDSQGVGDGLAQMIIEPSVKHVVFVRYHVDAMHPVWHTAKGAICEVHTDALQGYSGGSAPGTKVELYDSTLRTCGSLLQLQTLIASAIYHRFNMEQVPNPKSDEMPYATDKSNIFPTDSKDVWLKALGIKYGYNWQGDQPIYYGPGGPCNNTGELWHEGIPPNGDFCPQR